MNTSSNPKHASNDSNYSTNPHILIVCYGIGGASGFVFERMIWGLSQYYNIDLYVSSDSKLLDNLKDIKNITINTQDHFSFPKFLKTILKKKLILVDNGYLRLNGIISKYIIKYAGINPLNSIWTKKLIKHIKYHKKKYEAVIGLMDYNGFETLSATVSIAKTLRIKSIVYSTDANPVTVQWDKDIVYLKKAKKLLSKYFFQLNGLFFANEKMLEYEKNLFRFKSNIRLGVVYTVSPKGTCTFPAPKEKIFLYTGVLWGPRKVSYIFEAFKMLLQVHPDAKLCFVGTRSQGFSEKELSIFSEKEKMSIISIKTTPNLIPFYKEALCLVDINADYEGDPFLSSKITNYIKYNRPILCEASKDSPARLLFSNYSTIFVCNHNPNELFRGMCEIIESTEFDFDERKDLIEKFSIDSVIKHFHTEIQSIIGN